MSKYVFMAPILGEMVPITATVANDKMWEAEGTFRGAFYWAYGENPRQIAECVALGLRDAALGYPAECWGNC